MPTAAEYDEWGRWFSARGDEMSGLLVSALNDDLADVVTGGSLAVSVDVAIRASTANAMTAAGQLRELADECARRGRSAVTTTARCTSMRGGWRRTRRRWTRTVRLAAEGFVGGSPPSAPGMPVRPEAWVER